MQRLAHIKPERLSHALNVIHNWHLAANSQGSKHLIPLLALLEAGAGKMAPIVFEERPHEFDFWDKYFLIEPGARKPYYNPLTLKYAEDSYPHSNAATIRKNSYFRKWHAASMETNANGDSVWSLAQDYALITREKALSKGGKVFKVPVVDIAVILFWHEEFPDDANAGTLLSDFRSRFPQRDQDFRELFTFVDEDTHEIFTADAVGGPKAYLDAIRSVLVSDHPEASAHKGTPLIDPIEDQEDPLLGQVQRLLTFGTSGIIFRGAPGTGKTWYAQRIAATLVQDQAQDVFRVQFHPSFGYEDFIEGYKPDEEKTSGFAIVDKLFLKACDRATKTPGYVVVIIDEINRGDPARVFGELLTYIELSYRGKLFYLPFSGKETTVPDNLLLLGTMNPFDRSVSHVDAAFIRRFDVIDIPPSPEALVSMLEKREGLTDEQVSLIVKWFEGAQSILPIGLGHAFFKDVKDVDSLDLVWRYRIRPTAETILEHNPGQKENFLRSYESLVSRLTRTESTQ